MKNNRHRRPINNLSAHKGNRKRLIVEHMPRDPNLDHEAVKLYRDVFKFCPNRGTRKDIAVTVTNLELWKDVLENWGYRNKKGKWIKFNPLSARKMLSEYERREKLSERATTAAQRVTERGSSQKGLPVRVSKWRDTEMPPLPTAKGIDVRASRGTLERIVASALQEMQQPDRSNK